MKPALIIADEPTTALDVTIQAQILELLVDLQKKIGTSILMITHDLGVIAETTSRVIVMYAGEIVEEAAVDELFAKAQPPVHRRPDSFDAPHRPRSGAPECHSRNGTGPHRLARRLPIPRSLSLFVASVRARASAALSCRCRAMRRAVTSPSSRSAATIPTRHSW